MENTNEEDTVDIVCQTRANKFFDQVIGHIEDIVLSENFQKLHADFLEKHWSKFENKEENKLEYMDIFEEYSSTFEAFFVKELHQRMASFAMERFAQELNAHENAHSALGIIDTEIFELLYSFSNFQIFKDMLLDYRCKKEGRLKHLDASILVVKPIVQKIDSQ